MPTLAGNGECSRATGAASTEQAIRRKYAALAPAMDERMRRLWAGAEADAYGEGGIAAVERATGLSRTTIRAGRAELRGGLEDVEIGQVRRAGGGRRRLEDKDPALGAALESLIDPVARGDIESPMRWTSRSTRRLADELTRRGRPISAQKVAQLLRSLGYTLRTTGRAADGATLSPARRRSRFQSISDRIEHHLERGTPVIAVEARRRAASRAEPHRSERGPGRSRPIVDPILGRAVSSRVYDLSAEPAPPPADARLRWDTARLAVDSIARWWRSMGKRALPGATELFLAVGGDGAVSRPSRLRTELRRFAGRTGLTIHVAHLPAGTLRWTRVGHRFVSRVAGSWPDGPVVDLEATIQLVGSPRTGGARPGGGGSEDRSVDPCSTDGDWSYTILPGPRRS